MTEHIIIEHDEPTDTEAPKEKLFTARGVVKAVATHSVRFVVSSAITTLVPVEKKMDKRRVFIGSYVISGMINEKVKTFIDVEIDEKIDFYREVRAKVRELQASPAANEQ